MRARVGRFQVTAELPKEIEHKPPRFYFRRCYSYTAYGFVEAYWGLGTVAVWWWCKSDD